MQLDREGLGPGEADVLVQDSERTRCWAPALGFVEVGSFRLSHCNFFILKDIYYFRTVLGSQKI